MDYILSPKIAKKYYCETCDYRCSKESDYNKHLMTRKHKKSYCGVTMDDNDVKKNIVKNVTLYVVKKVIGKSI